VYEQRTARPVALSAFLLRLAAHVGIAFILVLGSLGAGMWGYAHFEHLGWRDAFLNAAMLLGGMGPVETPATPGGKLFAGFYALYAGLVFLVAAGILGAPLFHRLLHQFHWERGDDGRH
jgi:hypothetical protein